MLINEHPELIVAFEYDADCSATAALYRFIQTKYWHLLNVDEMKELALYPIYWCVRTIIGDPLSETKKIETRPSWHLRLYYALNKLIVIDIPSPNYGATPELLHAKEKLFIAAANYETDYLIKKNRPTETNLIAHLYRDKSAIETLEHDTVMSAWNKTLPLILNHTRRAAGEIFRQFPRDYKNQEYSTLYGNKFNHHYKITYKYRYKND